MQPRPHVGPLHNLRPLPAIGVRQVAAADEAVVTMAANNDS